MANSTFSLRPAPRGNLAEVGGLGGGRLRWSMTPEVTWVCRVRYSDVLAAASAGLTTQGTTIELEATSVPGRLVATFTPASGGEVEVVADLDPGDDQDDVIDLLATAIALESELDEERDQASAAANVATIAWLEGVGLVGVEAEFQPAQLLELRFDGTAAPGNYVFTFTGAGLVSPVPVTVAFGGGTATQLGVAVEAGIEAEAALSGVVLSADDDGSGTNLVQFAPGLADGAIAVAVPEIVHAYEATVGGTAADGDYVLTFDSAFLPAPVDVTVTRAGGMPATNDDLAAAFETAIEAHPQLAPLVSGVTVAANVATIATYAGVELSFEPSAPGTGTLAVVDVSDPEPAYDVSDDTPPAPAVTVGHTIALALSGLKPFPAHVCRLECPLVHRITAWSSAATITVDDAGEASTDVISGVSVSSGTGYLGSTGTSLGDVDVPEEAWDPRLVLTTAELAPTAGEFEIHVGLCPLPN